MGSVRSRPEQVCGCWGIIDDHGGGQFAPPLTPAHPTMSLFDRIAAPHSAQRARTRDDSPADVPRGAVYSAAGPVAGFTARASAAANAFNFSGSLRPGAASTPLFT